MPRRCDRFQDAASAIREGLYQLWDPEQAVAGLSALLREYPEIIDVHFWEQFPGEPIESGSALMELIARSVCRACGRRSRTGDGPRDG